MTASIKDVMDLELLDNNLFRSRFHRENFRKTLFGGQVLSQALMAAYKTVEQDRLPHSLHAYFLRPGTSETPVIYDVESVRDGRSLTSRRVVARQTGRPIFNMSTSFHNEEEGFFHQPEFPSGIPTPEELLEDYNKTEDDGHIPAPRCDPKQASSPFQLLPVRGNLFAAKEINEPTAYFWMRSSEPLPDDAIHHYCALAFASDFGLLATTLLPHHATIFDKDMFAASVDHAIWFHSSNFRIDDWMLCESHSPWAGSSRGFARGSVFTRDGTLVASTVQEGIIRKL